MHWACQSAENTDFEIVLPHGKFDTNSFNADLNQLVLRDNKDRLSQSAPPAKRRKIHSEDGLLQEIISNLYSLLGDQEVMDMDGLCHLAELVLYLDTTGYTLTYIRIRFVDLEDIERCKVIDYLAMIPCAAYGSLAITRDKFENIVSSRCFICEDLPMPEAVMLDDDLCQKTGTEAILILNTLIKSPAFIDSRRSRVLATLAIKTFAVHFRNEKFLNLDTSELGQWCLRGLKSSMREMRIAAGYVVVYWWQILDYCSC